ncbi:ABC transporter ATP-binding protein [Sphaerochaeta halotolerans]|uniref:ABC transporter ATP-binding protein n=1 Tax=Sphaerochaeta halotolerans TaxID=2293840 RepID=A0A372ME43_9SPIR|nr:ABC transporter ATP-binding protein [Sphaerochaeta halotolerans]RFU94057.1 ABC transporter ATP-binding protein [Sphaerochaeta halotolerans]
MTKLAKYLKPFSVGLILTILLLVVQVVSTLSLPNYMSDIVNVGIQQNGITHAAPEAISETGMQLITTFMDESEKQTFTQSYTRKAVTDVNKSGVSYQTLYPKATGALYVKQAGSAKNQQQLDQIFGAAAMTMATLLQDMGTADASAISTQQMDSTTLYQVAKMVDSVPQSAISEVHANVLEKDPSFLKQSGIVLSKIFLAEIGVDVMETQTSYILRIGMIMLVITLLGGIATILVSFLSSRISSAVARDLRKDVFERIENFTNAEFDRFSTASLITRCTNDVMQIQRFLTMGIRMIAYAPIMGLGSVLMAIDKSVSMSWIIAVACLVLIGLIMVLMAIVMPKFKVIQTLVDRLNLVSRENLSGLMVIRAFGTQAYEKQRFALANDDLTKTNLFVNRVMSLMMPLMTLVMNGVTLTIVWVGAHQIANSVLQVGDMMAFMQYALQIIMAFLMLSFMFVMAPRAAVSAGRIAEVLETGIAIKDPEHPEPFKEERKGYVEFNHVNFRYHNAEEDVLSDITFTAKPGEMTAIIGSTGSGKSTIANMILRFYDVTAGEILVDGVDVRQVRQQELREKIGYIPQKGMLFSGTIASNLRYGKEDATDAEVEDAARVAQAIDFIDEKPDRFDTPISQGGSNVSGGQKQRLSIARALIKKPEIFVFDDSFSALDYKTDVMLRKALNESTGDSTVIIIAQRVSTIKHAQQIIVLDKGRIVGKGTHEELLKTCTPYYEIASSQLSQEELA